MANLDIAQVRAALTRASNDRTGDLRGRDVPADPREAQCEQTRRAARLECPLVAATLKCRENGVLAGALVLGARKVPGRHG